MLVIKNKRTQQEQVVSEEDWIRISTHPQTQGKYIVVINKSQEQLKKAGAIKMIFPEEIVNYKNKQIKTLKEQTQQQQREEIQEKQKDKTNKKAKK